MQRVGYGKTGNFLTYEMLSHLKAGVSEVINASEERSLHNSPCEMVEKRSSVSWGEIVIIRVRLSPNTSLIDSPNLRRFIAIDCLSLLQAAYGLFIDNN